MNSIINLHKVKYPDLSEHRIVIAGGTGDVGEGIVRAWLKAGAHVIIPSRTDGKVARFKSVLSDLDSNARLNFVTGEYTSFTQAQKTADHIVSSFGDVTDIVAAIGGWWQGKKLWEVSHEDWEQYFINTTTAHTATARAWLPRLKKNKSYSLILGGSAVEPVGGASLISMQQAALLMMRRVLSAETKGEQRVTSQILGPVITRNRKEYNPEWVSNDEVGLVSLGIAANTEATDKDYKAYNKSEILENLQNLGIYPK